MTTIKVHLAEVPTDVLVWLVEQPPAEWHSVGRIVSHVAPEDADDAHASVADALILLRSAGYVVHSSEAGGWAATVDGQEAVKTAAKGCSDA